MADYRLTQQAIDDLESAFMFGLERFGYAQALAYQNSLEHIFGLMAENAGMGAKADPLNPATRVHFHASHRILYEAAEDGVLILSVEHMSKLSR